MNIYLVVEYEDGYIAYVLDAWTTKKAAEDMKTFYEKRGCKCGIIEMELDK